MMKRFAFLSNSLTKSLQMNKVVPFVGAGISIWEPSGMPTGYELLDSVLLGLMPSVMPDSLRRHVEKIHAYSPEIIFQAIHEILPEKSIFFNIYKAFEGRVPNLCHAVLAKGLSAEMKTILTTNQDCLLEDASGGFLKAVFNEEHFDLSGRNSQLFKIHGSSGGSSGSERAFRNKSIQFTLSQMATGLSPNKVKVMRELFADFTLLFIGYSGADYDVCDFLYNELRKRDRVIYWNVRPGTDLKSQQPNLWSLCSVYPDQVEIIEMDMRDLVVKIAEVWSVPIEESLIKLAYKDNVQSRVPNNRDLIRGWSVGLPEFYKVLAIGWILFSTNVPAGAEEAARLAFTLSCDENQKGMSLFLLGYSYREQSRHSEALSYLKKALKSFNSTGDLFRQAQTLHKIAESSSTLEMMSACHLIPNSKYHSGIRAMKQAIRLYQTSEDDNSGKTMQRANLGWAFLNEGQIYIRIGWTWRRVVPLLGEIVSSWCLKKAKIQIEMAKDVLSRSGDLRGVAQALIALADIEPYRDHAELGSNLSSRWTLDLVHKGNSLIRQCIKTETQGDFNLAMMQCKTAIECYLHLGVQAEISRACAIMVWLGLKAKDGAIVNEYICLCFEALNKTNSSFLFRMMILSQIWRALSWRQVLKLFHA